MKKVFNRENLRVILEIVFILGIMLLLVILIDQMGLKPENPSKIVLWASMIPVIFLAIAVHELGHLLMGLAQGFQFILFIVGPLGIKREGDKIKVYLNKDLASYGGMAATSPVTEVAANAQKFARLIIAGPIVSLLFGIFSLFLLNFLSPPYDLIAWMSGIFFMFSFFATTIPSKTGIFFTDRKRYQRLKTPGKDQEVELALLRIMGKYGQEKSYKNIDTQDIVLLINDDTAFIQFFGLAILLSQQIEKEGAMNIETKEQYEATAQKIPKSVKKMMDKEFDRLKSGEKPVK